MMPSPPSYHQSFSLSAGEFQAGVVRMNGADLVHQATLGSVLYDEARGLGALFNDNNFINNVASSDKMWAYFMIVSRTAHLPSFVGGAVMLETVLTEWNGSGFDHYPANYLEDFSLSPKLLREFLKRTPGAKIPKGVELGTHFMHEIMRFLATNTYGDFPRGMTSRGFIAEYIADGKHITHVLDKFKATLGSGRDSAILQFDSATLDTGKQSNIPIRTEGLKYGKNDIDTLSNIFITSWTRDDGEQKIVATFTEAISTYTGEPLVRVQFTSSGNLSEDENVHDVLEALVLAARSEIIIKGWASKARNVADICPAMVIHTLHEPQIISALVDMGAKPRKLGSHFMKPVIANLKNTPNDVVHFPIQETKPFTVVELSFDAETKHTDEKHIRRASG